MSFKVYVENCSSCEALIERYFIEKGVDGEIIGCAQDANLIVLSGGSDIGTHLYGQKNFGLTHDWPKRDDLCMYLWELAQEKGIKVAGICRGAQFIAAMLGGKLYQHIEGHCRGGIHKTQDGTIINSLHHQAIVPSDVLGEIIHTGPSFTAVGPHPSYRQENKVNVESFINDKAFGVQWHPEYLNQYSHEVPAVKWWIDKLAEFVK